MLVLVGFGVRDGCLADNSRDNRELSLEFKFSLDIFL